MSESIVVVTKVREIVAKNNKQMSGDVPAKLSQRVEQLIKDGIERASASGRQTLMAKDL